MPRRDQHRAHIALAAALGAALLCGCSVEILHDISESEANEVVAVLQRDGVQVEKERVSEGSRATYTVSVRRGDAPRTWSILRQKNLPRPKEQGLGEVFGDVGLVPTQTQERALLRHALAGEISRTLNSIDGVRQARVHIVIPRREPLAPIDATTPPPRAAVLLKVDSKLALSLEDVKRLVAGSVDGLQPETVNVVISRAAAEPPSESRTGVLVSLGPFLVAQQSRAAVTVVLIGAVALVLALALTLLLLLRRNRALARAVSTARASSSTSAAEASLNLLERSISRRP